ncbi:MAG: hypothetical protein P8N76_24990 [Pirellulaceae bacterium]|nr:hypothetical protein [Pirellulaceae bacterium]
MLKRQLVTAFSITAMFIAGTLVAEDAKKTDLSKVKCIVSGKAITPEATADYKGGKVYFCCPGCPGAFAKNTKKFATKANHQLAMTGQFVQTNCPMSGKPAKADKVVKVAGVDVAFCCGNCTKAAASKKGDEQINLIFNDKSFKNGFEVAKKK